MSILSAVGITSARKIRYAIVALGDIAQEAMLPGVSHTGNSEVTALVTNDPEKARRVGEQYGVTDHYTYDRFAELLRSGTIDAIYLATPNWRHAEFAVPALKAGIHVLLEKPMEVSAAKAQAIVAAQQESSAKLMIAYRLHFEPATLDTIERVRRGDFGEVTLFTATFGQMVSPANHRATNGDLAGPVLDMGPYPINAARYIFGAEPTEVVSAIGTRHPQAGLGDFDDTVAVTLRFPEERIAQFVVSYYANPLNTYFVVGSKGSVQLDPAFMYGSALQQRLTIGDKTSTESFKNTDHFGGQMKYFSDCILEGRDPEPDGEEGLADLRVIDGIFRALKTGERQVLAPFTRTRRIDTAAQVEKLAAQKSPDLVNTSSPAKGVDKTPKN